MCSWLVIIQFALSMARSSPEVRGRWSMEMANGWKNGEFFEDWKILLD